MEITINIEYENICTKFGTIYFIHYNPYINEQESTAQHNYLMNTKV